MMDTQVRDRLMVDRHVRHRIPDRVVVETDKTSVPVGEVVTHEIGRQIEAETKSLE
jgi:hypothetical protein